MFEWQINRNKNINMNHHSKQNKYCLQTKFDSILKLDVVAGIGLGATQPLKYDTIDTNLQLRIRQLYSLHLTLYFHFDPHCIALHLPASLWYLFMQTMLC